MKPNGERYIQYPEEVRRAYRERIARKELARVREREGRANDVTAKRI
jgi:hypothetical protein